MTQLGYKIIGAPPRGYHGKRARRAAFYDRQRTARLLQRLMRATETFIYEGYEVDWRRDKP